MNIKRNSKNIIDICFVCTDNFARSLIAEYCLNKYAHENGFDYIKASSAGTDISRDTSSFCFAHLDELKKMGMNANGHKRTQLDKEVIERSSLLVAMAEYHQGWIKDNFRIKAPMFSEIMGDKKTSYRVPPPPSTEREAALREMVHEIYGAMPMFVKVIDKRLDISQ